MENEMPSLKINIVDQNLDRKCTLTWEMALYQRNGKFEIFPIFPDFPIFYEKILEQNPDRDTQ